MTIEQADRTVTTQPEGEGSPSPATVYEIVMQAAREDAEFLERERAKMAAIRRTERVLVTLAVYLAAGIAVAWVVDRAMVARYETSSQSEKVIGSVTP